MVNRRPYSGQFSKIVIAFDVGTTFSGASFCILERNQVPEIQGVTKYPYQVNMSGGDSKVPSIIWYDQTGKVPEDAIGAGAVRDGIEDLADTYTWVKVEWFKLRLRPQGLAGEDNAKILKHTPPLPFGLTIIDVFADFL
ncbi:hypothetical protein BDN72DRAFT_806415 [Pluteus cervinus]|uniref:Uncharacterized protein n=1 Tax=Pluteus cervinus TaxID=181527 RepID=A0ACD2ZZE0_9AGAR|nr:hypothetical protein BDN72DRAFT_806415 [Pluteus cervinus]